MGDSWTFDKPRSIGWYWAYPTKQLPMVVEVDYRDYCRDPDELVVRTPNGLWYNLMYEPKIDHWLWSSQPIQRPNGSYEEVVALREMKGID